MSEEQRDRMLDQYRAAAGHWVPPEGVTVNFTTVDGGACLTFLHPGGIVTVPVDPATGEMNAEDLARAITGMKGDVGWSEERCAAITTKGRRCKGAPVNGPWCEHHDPNSRNKVRGRAYMALTKEHGDVGRMRFTRLYGLSPEGAPLYVEVPEEDYLPSTDADDEYPF